MSRLRLVLSCEHASKRVPREFRGIFAGHARMLDSHRGHDPGALQAARDFARAAGVPLLAGSCTRLLVDLNRSRRHPRLFVGPGARLSPAERRTVLARWYLPYRSELERRVRAALASGDVVLHLSVHSFTPKLRGEVRRADVGLLYDPSRLLETGFCDAFHAALARLEPGLRIRRNYPYRGTSDGCTTELRQALSARRYAGIELEISQRFPRGDARRWRGLRRSLAAALRAALDA
jgi:predicted N-formylglutamate amidohydrolase